MSLFKTLSLVIIVLSLFMGSCIKDVTPRKTTNTEHKCQFEFCETGEYSVVNPCLEDCVSVEGADYYITCLTNNIVVLSASYQCAVETWGYLNE